MQAREFLEREPVGGFRRIEPRVEQRLVRVDVADTGDPPLIHDRFLHRGARAFQAVGEHERCERLSQRLGSDPARIRDPPLLVEKPDRAQAPHIAVDKLSAVGQRADQDDVFQLAPRQRAVIDQQRARHARLDDHPVAG